MAGLRSLTVSYVPVTIAVDTVVESWTIVVIQDELLSF